MQGGLAFMFETSLMLKLTPWAMSAPHRDADYQKCWHTLPRNFKASAHGASGMALGEVDNAGASSSSASSAAAAGAGEETGEPPHKRKHT